jgi:hypothetical protein
MEIWKDIIGYEGLYQISNIGRVKSLNRIVIRKNGYSLPVKERIIAFHKHRDGYNMVRLWNNKSKLCTIHRLVAQSFLDNPNNYPNVHHCDNDPSNNSVDNLEWVTQAKNIQYASKYGRMRNQHSKMK